MLDPHSKNRAIKIRSYRLSPIVMKFGLMIFKTIYICMNGKKELKC
jgi:hypothetical protein